MNESNRRNSTVSRQMAAQRAAEVEKAQHGGPGRGQGRKPLDPNEPTERRTVTMPASYWQIAKELGNGQYSAGIRKLIEDNN